MVNPLDWREWLGREPEPSPEAWAAIAAAVQPKIRSTTVRILACSNPSDPWISERASQAADDRGAEHRRLVNGDWPVEAPDGTTVLCGSEEVARQVADGEHADTVAALRTMVERNARG